MPTYVYRCPECGREEEHIRNISDRLEYVFCTCDKHEWVMKLVMGAPAFTMGEMNMGDRLNRNWDRRKERAKKGTLLK